MKYAFYKVGLVAFQQQGCFAMAQSFTMGGLFNQLLDKCTVVFIVFSVFQRIQNFFVLDSVEYKDGIIFRERVLDKVLNLYKPEIYKLSDYSKLWIDNDFYPYGNEFMIVK